MKWSAYQVSLPRADTATILVVDDHEPAVRIIQRYLSHTNVNAIGITDPGQVLPVTRAAHL